MVFKCQEDSFLKEVCCIVCIQHFFMHCIVCSLLRKQCHARMAVWNWQLMGKRQKLMDTKLNWRIQFCFLKVVDRQIDLYCNICFVLMENIFQKPCDYGYLNETKVLQVRRQGGDAIHFVTSPLPVGEDVKQTVEWNRRFDHMQQHSGTVQHGYFFCVEVLYIFFCTGQHLLSALLERDYAYNTDSWWLGEDVSYIELGR